MLNVGYKTLAVLICAFAMRPAGAQAQAPKPVLVELFTSEGCSDCPPADAFLSTLDSGQPVPGVQLIVLEEHVDYWDHDGWRDPFSSHQFTVRQSDYAERMRLASPYTPQMIVDGTYQFVGSDLRSAAKAFEGAQSTAKVAIRLGPSQNENGVVRAQVETDPVPAKADLLVAMAANSGESQVLAGENRGRHLEHVAIVRSLTKLAKLDEGRTFSREISVKSLPQPARLVVFIQERNEGKVLGAVVERIENQTPARP
jgi:hypothetical protein